MPTTNYEYSGQFIPGVYFPEFDPTGLLPANRVTGEKQTITAENDKDYHVIVPIFAPFFSTGLTLTFKAFGSNTQVPLTEGVDYLLAYQFIGATRGCAKPVYGGISFINNQLSGEVTLSYQTVGGNWVLNISKINEVLSNQLQNPRVTSWEQIVQLPSVFPVIDHQWDLVDLVGASSIVQAIDRISSTIIDQIDLTDVNNVRIILEAQILELSTAVDNYYSSLVTSLATTDLQVLRNRFDINDLKDFTNILSIKIDTLNQDLGKLNIKLNHDLDSIRELINTKTNDLNTAVTTKVEELAKIVAWQQEVNAEVLRGNGQTGLFLTRAYTLNGPDARNRPFGENFNPAGIHSHSNYDGMPGTAEFSLIVNGYYLRTRHNDYLLRSSSNAGWLATDKINAQPIPSVVTGDINQQTAAMRQLFTDYANGGFPAGFSWSMSYIELWFEPLTSNISDAFNSFRHQQRVSDIDSAFKEVMRYNAGGYKDRFENIAVEAPVVKFIDNGKAVYARLRYRIVAVDLSSLGDLRPFLEPVDDRAYAQGFGRKSGRFLIKENVNGPGKLDEIMQLIPGMSGPGTSITETYSEYGQNTSIRTWDGSQSINAAYYSRYCKAFADAANRDAFHRGFNDPTMFAALTNREEVLPINMDGKTYRFTYAIPFELVLRTPLETWNPFNIPNVESEYISNGRGTQANPYLGYSMSQGVFFRTPTGFFTGNAVGDQADTGQAEAWILDGSGIARPVRGSGIYVNLPNIAGIGTLKIRHPVFPLYHEGSFAYAQVKALAEDTDSFAASALEAMTNTNRMVLEQHYLNQDGVRTTLFKSRF